MAKSRTTKRSKKTTKPAQPQTSKSKFKAAALAIFIGVAVLAGGGLWQTQQPDEAAFLDLVGQHEGPLKGVRTMPDLGRTHMTPGQTFEYPGPYPTSGPHSTVWTRTGVYDDLPPDVELVHALEHGNIVIYYDQIDEKDLATLEQWADLYDAQWSGIVVARNPGIGDKVVLTAWRKILSQTSFDEIAAAAFIDTYRGRGPEHPVR